MWKAHRRTNYPTWSSIHKLQRCLPDSWGSILWWPWILVRHSLVSQNKASNQRQNNPHQGHGVHTGHPPTCSRSIATKFPRGIPTLSKLLICTHANWAHKVSSRSEKGPQLVLLYAAILEQTSITIAYNHIAWKTNLLANFISRPPTHLPFQALVRHQQIFAREPTLPSYCYFWPHPKLLSSLESKLSNKQWTATTTLPKLLGQFEAAASMTSSFVTL